MMHNIAQIKSGVCALALGGFLFLAQGCDRSSSEPQDTSPAEQMSVAEKAPELRDLSALLKPILAESQLPSLVAAVVVGDEIRGVGAAGIRKLGDPTSVTDHDKYHIGSCTKSMTATLTAILIEDGLLEWNTTIGDVLGKEILNLHSDYRDVTIEQLLAHVGGFPTQAPPKPWSAAWRNQGKMTPLKQRMIFATDVLSSKPDYQPGAKTVYSNQGYAVAGVMLESLAGKPWEELMRERLFAPLGMKSAGAEGRQSIRHCSSWSRSLHDRGLG